MMPILSAVLHAESLLKFVWLAAMIVLCVVEVLTVNLITIWFALGALAALISSLFGAPVWLQVVWFLVVSILTLALTKPLVKKYVNSKTQATNADMVIGATCVVVEPINNLSGTGAVTVGGKTWTARSEYGEVFAPGERVIALRIEGVKLIVAASSTVTTV